MSRMRNVQGVTRVSLAKSDKDASGAGGAAGAAGPAVNPCGKGAPPSFEVVIFFERSAVAGALAGVTGAVDPAAAAAAAAGRRRHDPRCRPAPERRYARSHHVVHRTAHSGVTGGSK